MGRTFVMIKPDAVRRGLIGEIISRFEKKGFSIDDMRYTRVTIEGAQELYKEHKDKDFYKNLIEFIISGPVIIMIVAREGLSVADTVQQARLLIGAIGLPNALGTIRGDFATSSCRNCVHVSDSMEASEREPAMFALKGNK